MKFCERQQKLVKYNCKYNRLTFDHSDGQQILNKLSVRNCKYRTESTTIIKFKNSFTQIYKFKFDQTPYCTMPGSDSGKKQQQMDQDPRQLDENGQDLGLEMDDDDDDDEDYELGQEQVIQTILALGNEIWRNFGQEEEIDDYAVFFQHQFYIECFQMAYRSYDFSDLVKATDDAESPEQMAACIQALINLLSEEILAYDMNHIRGDEIVNGNAEHCINLLQILQQISSASMMQEASADGSEMRSESQQVPGQGELRDGAGRRPSQPDKLQGSGSSVPDGSNSGNAPKSRATTGEKGKDTDPTNQNAQDPLFDAGMGNIEDLDGAEGDPAFLRSGPNKHQFLDNLDEEIGMNDDDEDEQDMDEVGAPNGAVRGRADDRNGNSKLGADKVGDVIGQELDVEFEADIQDNLQNHEGRGSAGSADSSEQQTAGQLPPNQKQQILDGEDNEFDEHGEIVDPNDVNIIEDGQEFLDDDQNDDSERDPDAELRNLNRQSDNIANLERQMRGTGGPNQMADYNDELDGEDDDGLHELQDGSDQYDENQQLILDDQNLDMDDMHDLGPPKGVAGRRGDGGHDDPDDDVDDDGELDLDDIDPALLEAAVQQLALAPDGYQVPDSDLMQHRTEGVGEDQDEEGSPISDGEDDQEEVQGLAEILDGVDADGQHSDEGVGKQILRGGQNIEDDQQLDVDDEDEDDLPDVEVREMSEKLKLLHEQDHDQDDERALRQMRQQMEEDEDDMVEDDDQGQDAFGDDDEPMIDTDNLDDKEKALLCRYLQAEYEKDPESLPMPREVVEEFLARNQDLLEQLDELDEDGQGQLEMRAQGPSTGLGDAAGESLNNGIDSNEIVVEGQQDDDDNKSSSEGDDGERGAEDGMGNRDPALALQDGDEEDEPGAELEDDAEDQYLDREQMEQQQRMQVGEMNIEGSEQNLDDEENMAANGFVPAGANDYVVQQHPGGPEEGDPGVQDYGEEEDAGEDEDDQNAHQMFNPQYELDEIQEVEQDDGNGYLFQNINVQAQQPANLTEEQLLFIQQQQLPLEQLNLQQPGLMRKSTGKRKKLAGAYARKPPAPVHVGAFQRGSAAGLLGRAGTSAAAKKPRRARLGGNTISHDEEQQSHGGRQLVGLDGNYGASRSAQRRPNSHKRPQTAKPRKTIGLGGKARQRYNNFMGAPPSGSFKAAVTSSTPSNRLRSGKALGAGAGSLKNMIIPQQSQMFTSFGVPHGAMQSISQRKAASNPKKRYQGLYGSVKGAALPTKKKTRAANQASVPRLARNAKKMLQYQGQGPAQAPAPQNVSNQPIPTAATEQAQSLVEMPILSEEFLNQLNEEQLQALLEQQQQLMMLQQQNQVQTANGNLAGLQDEEQEQQFQNQVPEDGQLYQPQHVGSLQQQSSVQSGVRSRGRAKAYAQAGGPPLAARIPSASRKGTVPASAGGPRASSGSRSAHGSRKRTQKTRSSLNIASSGPLSLGPPMSGLGPAGAASSNSIFRSQKMAAQIYGSSADSMLNNLISQRKKSGKGGKKRSQPNQAGKALAHQLNQMQQSSEPYDIQAQLLAQQAQYNKLLAQQQPGVAADPRVANQLHPGYGQAPDAAQGNGQGVQREGTEGTIAEVPPEQEEAESQSQFNQLSQQQRQQLLMQMQQQQMVGGGQSNIQPLQGQISNIADDLSTEQIIELLQNAADAQNSQNGELDGEGNFDENGAPINQNQGQQLPEEIQLQLQQVLQERMLQQQQQQFLLQQQQMLNSGLKQSGRPAPVAEAIAGMALNDRVQSYQNICNILTESVAKARKRHGHLTGAEPRRGRLQSTSASPQRPTAGGKALGSAGRESLEADQRILKQKKQFENLLRQYRMDLKLQETKRQQDLRRAEKIAIREERIQQMKQKKFEEGMITQQRSQIIKRNAQQARLCKKVFQLASELEKDKLLEEKKQLKEQEHQKVSQRRAMVQTIENYYKDKIDMLKDRIDQEKFERQVAQEAQKKAFSQMKRELGDQKRKEVERYIQLLQQEDDKFDLSNLNASRLEHEVVRLYKKKP